MTNFILDPRATIKQIENAGTDTGQGEAVVAAICHSDAELAITQDLAVLKADIWRIGASIVGGTVLLYKIRGWVIG